MIHLYLNLIINKMESIDYKIIGSGKRHILVSYCALSWNYERKAIITINKLNEMQKSQFTFHIKSDKNKTKNFKFDWTEYETADLSG